MAKILNNKIYFFILLTVIILFIAITCVFNYVQTKSDRTIVEPFMTTSVSWAHGYRNIDKLCTKADLIVMGTIDDVIAETYEAIDSTTETEVHFHFIYFTDFSFRVDRVLKGEEETQITIHQTGAIGKQEVRDDPLFIQGEQYILFLREYEDGKYCVLGGPQGRFKIVGDEVFTMNRVFPDKVVLPQGLDINGMQKTDFIDSISRQVSN